MYCKYCKDTMHDINTCTRIKCLNCESKGHPHWKCPLSIRNNNIKKRKKKIKKNKKQLYDKQPGGNDGDDKQNASTLNDNTSTMNVNVNDNTNISIPSEPTSPTSSDDSSTLFKTPWKQSTRSWADMCSSDED